MSLSFERQSVGRIGQSIGCFPKRPRSARWQCTLPASQALEIRSSRVAIDPEVPVQDLTIYLLKDKIKDIAEALRSPHTPGLKKFIVKSTSGASTVGELFIRPPKPHPPDWARWFENHVDLTDVGRLSSTAGLFIVKTQGRLFALTFGMGRSLLTPDCWEERFGLRVAVNAVKPDQLRSVDKRTFDALSTHARVQASREGAAPDFGLDVEQDLVRGVTGVPRDENLGARLTGADSLHTTLRVRVEDVKPVLKAYLDRFDDRSYKKTFPWIDHIAEITDKSLLATLDAALLAHIKGKREQCWLPARTTSYAGRSILPFRNRRLQRQVPGTVTVTAFPRGDWFGVMLRASQGRPR
jgi:uncharacterized protein (TIGR04141 family)